MPKPQGVTFNRYAAICGRILRKALKPEQRAAVQKQDVNDVKLQKWANGKAEASHVINVPLGP